LNFACIGVLIKLLGNAKSRVRRSLYYAILVIITVFFEALSFYLESGMYIATSIILWLTLVCACLWGNEVTELLALPIFSLNAKLQRRVQTALRLTFVGIVLVNGVTSFVMASLARVDDVRFNIAAAVQAFVLFASEFLYCLIIFHYSGKLKKLIDASSLEAPDAQKLHKKIGGLRGSSVSLTFGQVPQIICCIIFLAIGTFPYMFVVSFIVLFNTAPSLTWASYKLISTYKTIHSSQLATVVSSEVGSVVNFSSNSKPDQLPTPPDQQ
jgi:hypothetical protein